MHGIDSLLAEHWTPLYWADDDQMISIISLRVLCSPLRAETPVKNSSKSPCCLTSDRRWTPAVANNWTSLFFFSPAYVSVLQTFTARCWQCDHVSVCVCVFDRKVRWGDRSPALIQTYDVMATWCERQSQKRARNIKRHMVTESRVPGWTQWKCAHCWSVTKESHPLTILLCVSILFCTSILILSSGGLFGLNREKSLRRLQITGVSEMSAKWAQKNAFKLKCFFEGKC